MKFFCFRTRVIALVIAAAGGSLVALPSFALPTRDRETYDDTGRLVSLRLEDDGLAKYEYEPDGSRKVFIGPELAAIEKPDGSVHAFAYDPAGRLVRTRITRPGAEPEYIDHPADEPAATDDQEAEFSPEALALMPAAARSAYANMRLASYTPPQSPAAPTASDIPIVTLPVTSASARAAFPSSPKRASLAVTLASTAATQATTTETSFLYDPLGRLVSKTIGDTTTDYLYDGHHILVETIRTSAGTERFLYIYGPGIDEVLARKNMATGEMTYFHADALGSIVATTNGAGQKTASYDYGPFGVPSANHPGGPAFTGRWWYPEVQLYNYRARWYSPHQGRFISEDPIGFAGGVNFYAYANNNPVLYRDPFGLETTIVTVVNPMTTNTGWAFHSAIHMTNGGEPVFYDPSGAYRNTTRGSSALFYDEEANLFDYIQNSRSVGEWVETQTFATTAEQESQILSRIRQLGDRGRPFSCTSNVSTAISGIGPFSGVTKTAFPKKLSYKLRSLPGGSRWVFD